MLNTLKIPPPAKGANTKQEYWDEMRSLFPMYIALAKQSKLEIPFPQERRILPEKPDAALARQVETWLGQMDQKVMVPQLRHLLQRTTLSDSESGLHALILRHLRKTAKTTVDRDKIDFLLVQYFALCVPPKIYHKQIELADVAKVLEPVLGPVDSAPLSWCEPLDKMIEQLRTFRSLREMLKTDFIDRGRKVKETAGGMFYDPCAMLAFIRFNFLMRRTLIELMHADLIAIRSGLGQLDATGVRTIDCRQLGMSATEPVQKIRQLADEWNQPFQGEYNERTVNQAFEKLLGLRADVERALEKVPGKAAPAPTTSEPAAKAPAAKEESRAEAKSPAKQAEPASRSAGSEEPSGELEFETCMEKIWEQLIAAPPSRGRSMTTIRLGPARILMSSWEVAAFVSEDGFAAEDLRRAVVARALVTVATEMAKESGNATGLDNALSVARIEISRLQERVDAAKQAKDTEAAVNLGISTKRLLSALDEAEKL